MTEKQKGAAILAFAVVIAVAWLTLRLHQSGRSLGNLTRIGSIQHWQLGHLDDRWGGDNDGLAPTAPYLWLNSRELLHFTGDTAQGSHAAVFDAFTHHDSTELGLSAIQRDTLIAASPDGQWILWSHDLKTNEPLITNLPLSVITATRCDDGKTVQWPDAPRSGPGGCWLPDSRRWVVVQTFALDKKKGWTPLIFAERTGRGRPGMATGVPGHVGAEQDNPGFNMGLAVYSVDRPGFHFFPLRPSSLNAIMGVTTQNTVILGQYNPPSSTNRPQGMTQPPLSLREVALASPRPVERTFQVALPQTPPGGLSRVLLSPQGDRLLWICLSLQHSLFGGENETQPMKSLDVWVCPLNGNSPRHVGTWSDTQIGRAYWNPDGRHISVTIHGVLYSAPVD